MVARKLTTALFAMLMLTAGVASGAGALAAPVSTTDQQTETGMTLQETNNSSVNVTTGQQLSTVLAVTSDDVQTEVEETEFEVEYEEASDDERAEALADRASRIRERAEEIRDAYRTATEAYEAGELTKSEYAQQIATLNAQAGNLIGSYQSLSAQAESLSTLELRTAGFNSSALDESMNGLDNVSGTGAAALLQQFTGQSDGEVEISSENGLAIEVESEDGEQSRELERPGDDSANLTVTQSTALDTARDALTDVNSSWRLVNSRIDRDDGNYEFRFHVNTDTTVGQASVTVDGSSGTVVELESKTRLKGTARAEEVQNSNSDDDLPEDAERRDDDDREDEDEREIALLVVDGEIEPNSTITVRALADGEPVTDEAVLLNGEQVGTTDADGTVTVTLPATGEVELTAGEGELEFELGEEEEKDEIYRNMTADATLDGDTVTATVQYDGSGVSDASVYANGEMVGTTDADGTVSFTVANDTESLEVELVKGEFEAEFEYELTDGTLSQTEGPHGSDNGSERAEEAGEDGEDRGEGPPNEAGAEDDEEETEDDDETETDEAEDDDDEQTTETPETAEQ